MGYQSIMASFSVKSFERKLKEMSARQDSVQTVSLWLIHHRAHSRTVVNLWLDHVKKAKPDRRLILFYLANDIIQNSRKKGKEFSQSFSKVLADSMQYLRDTSIRPSVERVLKIWQERKVFDKDLVQKLLDQLNHVLKPKAKPKPKPVPEATAPKKENDKVEKKKKLPKRPVPANFKTINVTHAIATMQGIEDETERRQTLVSQMRLDASSSDGIKQLKDYAGGNRFSLEFEESSTKYEDLEQSLEAESQQRQVLVNLLEDGDSYYEAALKEATIIANAYRSFGNRLHSMKKKLDNKIRKFATAAKEAPVSAPKASFLSSGLSGILEQMNRSPAGTPSSTEQDKKTNSVKEEKKIEEDENELYDPASVEIKESVDPTVDHVEVADMDIESDSDHGGDDSEPSGAPDTNSSTSAMSTPKPVPSAPDLSKASPSSSKVPVQTTTPQFGYTMTVNSAEETETSSPASHDSAPSPDGSPELNLEIYEGPPVTNPSTQLGVMENQSFLAGINNEQKPGAGSPTVNLFTHLMNTRRRNNDGSSVEGTPERGSDTSNTPLREETNNKQLMNLLGNLFPKLNPSVYGNAALQRVEVSQSGDINDQTVGDVSDRDLGVASEGNLVESEQKDSVTKLDSGPSTDEEGAGGDNTPEHGPEFSEAPPMILRSDATFPRPPIPPPIFSARFPGQAFQNRPSMARPPFMPSNEAGVRDGQRRPSIEEQLMEEHRLREIRSPGLRSPRMSGPPMEWERRPPFGPRGNVLPANILGESRDPRLRRREQLQMLDRARDGPPFMDRVPPIEMRGRPPGMEMRSEGPPFMERQGLPPIDIGERLRREENNMEVIRRRLSSGDERDGPIPIEERERRIRELREGHPAMEMRPELQLMDGDRREGPFPFERHEHPMDMRERFHPVERDVPQHIDTRDGPLPFDRREGPHSMELRDGPPHMRDLIHPMDRRHPSHPMDRPDMPDRPFDPRGPPIDGPHLMEHRNKFHAPEMQDGHPPDEVPTSEEESPVDDGDKPPVGVPPEVYFSEGGDEGPPVQEAPQIDNSQVDYSLDDTQFDQGEGQIEQAGGPMFRSGMQRPEIRPLDERSAFDIRPGFHGDNHRPFGRRDDNNRPIRPMGGQFGPRHERPGRFPGPRNFHHRNFGPRNFGPRNFGPRNFRPRHENEGGRPRFPPMHGGGPRLKRSGPPFHPDFAKRPHY